MHVLNIVTNDKSQFFRHQVATLEQQGVKTSTISVPGENKSASVTAGENERRSILNYARFVPNVIKASFGPYDLLHANYGLTAPPAIVQPNLPVVLSLWGSDLMGEYGWFTKRVVPYVDAVIVMSERMAEQLDRECHVIPHGVNRDRFTPTPQETAQSTLDWNPDHYHVLFPYPPKRPVKNFPRAKRVVEASRTQLSSPLEFHTVSGVDHSEMPTYMNAADVMLLTSRREGSPNTIKEALACNLPVVATDVGDARERLDGVTPSRVCRTDRELVDGLVDILRQGERSNGREQTVELSLERMGERIRRVYEQVLNGKSDSVGSSRRDVVQSST